MTEPTHDPAAPLGSGISRREQLRQLVGDEVELAAAALTDQITAAILRLDDPADEAELAALVSMDEDRIAALNRAEALLRDVGGYLAALHQHAARHDALGDRHACAGCHLYQRIHAHLDQP